MADTGTTMDLEIVLSLEQEVSTVKTKAEQMNVIRHQQGSLFHGIIFHQIFHDHLQHFVNRHAHEEHGHITNEAS